MEILGAKAVECERHGGYMAKLIRISGRDMPQQMCPECRKEQDIKDRDAALAQLAAERRQTRIEQILKRSGIPERFKGRRFENYEVNCDGQMKALRVCEGYVRDFDVVRKTGQSLILAGLKGTGKTHLACSIANYLMPLGYSALFLGAMDAIRRIRATWSRDSHETELQVMQALRNVDLLILDEVGVQFGTEAELTQIFEIINNRYLDMKPTVILTNVFADDLARIIGERTLDRLREHGGRLVPFDWESYRSKA